MTTSLRPLPVPLLALRFVRILSRYLLLVWLGMTVVCGLIVTGIALFGETNQSIVELAYTGSRYWVMVIGVILTPAMVRSLISHGITRRTFLTAGLLGALPVVVLAALLPTSDYWLEGLAYRGLGWRPGIDGPHVFTATDQLGGVFAEYLLVFALHFFAGWLIGSLFYRWALWAVPPAVLGVLVVAAAEGALHAGFLGMVFDTAGYREIQPAGVVVAVTVTVGFVALNWLTVRDVALRAART